MKKLLFALILSIAVINIQDVNAEDLSGKVVETLNSGGYTYVNIEQKGNSTWVAVPQSHVSVGKTLSFHPGAVMTGFTSKTLDRTFDTIVFSAGIKDGETSSPVQSKSNLKPPPVNVNVNKAEGPDSYTVAELYDKSAALDNKNVVISGKVVKFSPQIMGKNWIHIQDGSGDASKGTNDLIVTLQETLSVGDTVTLEGILAKDKDYGSGYKYAVILENASIKK